MLMHVCDSQSHSVTACMKCLICINWYSISLRNLQLQPA